MDPLREIELDLLGSVAEPRIAKFQKLWRAKRVFTNSQVSWKLSPAAITAKIVSFSTPILIKNISFQDNPKGVSEIMCYQGTGQKPILRWLPSTGWVGTGGSIKKVVAKKGQLSIVMSTNVVDVLGLGNYEEALLTVVRNGWASKDLLHMKPTYKKIDGIFNVNKPISLEDLKQELHKLPKDIVKEITYTPEIKSIPAVVLKLKKPAWTYQFFANGTILFTGIKDPDDREVPKQLFKNFFTEYGLLAILVFNLGAKSLIKKPTKEQPNKKQKLANRYPLAGTWNALKTAPHGFYIRPGTNGKPRFYMWRRMEQNMTTREWLNRGAMNLAGVGPKVVKAFENAGKPIPKSTLNAFTSAGYPLNTTQEPKKSAAKHAERRAPSWDATKPGFYVRPGPGQQPYWFKIPAGIASGRKTVIATYTKAGRNIPKAVRNIFKIGNNVKVEKGLNHKFTIGLNGILRINNRQATRLTKAELIQIARNMNIAQVNSAMPPSRIIAFIQREAGVAKANRNFHVQVGNVKYKLLNNFRIERTVGKTRTTRAWDTFPADEKSTLVNALIPNNSKQNFNKLSKQNQYTALYGFSRNKASPSPAPSSSGSSISLGNISRNLEYRGMLENKMGSYFKYENVDDLLAKINALPSGSRGKPLKATIDKAVKNFIQEKVAQRRANLIRSNFESKIVIPSWLPANKHVAFKKTMLNIASTAGPKGKFPTQKDIKEGMRAWLNAQLPKVGRPAYEKENMETGVIIKVPAWNPPKNFTFAVPKRLSPPKR